MIEGRQTVHDGQQEEPHEDLQHGLALQMPEKKSRRGVEKGHGKQRQKIPEAGSTCRNFIVGRHGSADGAVRCPIVMLRPALPLSSDCIFPAFSPFLSSRKGRPLFSRLSPGPCLFQQKGLSEGRVIFAERGNKRPAEYTPFRCRCPGAKTCRRPRRKNRCHPRMSCFHRNGLCSSAPT